MTKILVAFRLDEATRNKYIEAAPGCDIEFAEWKEFTKENVAGKDIIIGNIQPEMIKYADKVKWIQLNSAGSDVYMKDPSLLDGIVLTNASGSFGIGIAEYMVGAVIGLKMDLFKYDRDMQDHVWSDEGPVSAVTGSTVLIAGLGDLGSEFAWRMHALGAKVIAVKRTMSAKPDYVDELYTIDTLDDLLPRADVVALTMPETKETYHMFGKARFAKMKKSAVFVNTGRGTLVVQSELAEALREGVIAGACVDVFEKEPLPDDDPLWDTPNLFMTPHVSGGWNLDITMNKMHDIILNNLRSYLAGGELTNIVDLKREY